VANPSSDVEPKRSVTCIGKSVAHLCIPGRCRGEGISPCTGKVFDIDWS
jgi:hypothetical protein